MKRVNDLSICPVLGLEKYVNESKKLNINLGNGYLFRALSASRKVVLDNPVTSAAMSDRFQKYLSAVNIFEGETLHGLRGACAINPSFHWGWRISRKNNGSCRMVFKELV